MLEITFRLGSLKEKNITPRKIVKLSQTVHHRVKLFTFNGTQYFMTNDNDIRVTDIIDAWNQ